MKEIGAVFRQIRESRHISLEGGYGWRIFALHAISI